MMQQRLFPEAVGQHQKNKYNQVDLGGNLELRIPKDSKSHIELYRFNVFIKTVDLSDKVAKRLFVVDVVELGATKVKLAKALDISRQTIHNYLEIKKNFGNEGLIHSYHASSRSLSENKIFSMP